MTVPYDLFADFPHGKKELRKIRLHSCRRINKVSVHRARRAHHIQSDFFFFLKAHYYCSTLSDPSKHLLQTPDAEVTALGFYFICASLIKAMRPNGRLALYTDCIHFACGQGVIAPCAELHYEHSGTKKTAGICFQLLCS